MKSVYIFTKWFKRNWVITQKISKFYVSFFSCFHYHFPQIISFQYSHKCSWHVSNSSVVCSLYWISLCDPCQQIFRSLLADLSLPLADNEAFHAKLLIDNNLRRWAWGKWTSKVTWRDGPTYSRSSKFLHLGDNVYKFSTYIIKIIITTIRSFFQSFFPRLTVL